MNKQEYEKDAMERYKNYGDVDALRKIDKDGFYEGLPEEYKQEYYKQKWIFRLFIIGLISSFLLYVKFRIHVPE